ncbi:FISUMP domain-containing protein [Tenacibaculum sp. TC6]|uniref:FISUMP domain-containing protein n=1 Tax=Tenacibaculum sp. TC6 TaxID=3423223 RepID=UPI003D3689F6
MNLNFTFFFIFLIFTSCKPTNENKTQKETIIDEHDSQEYPIIKIGDDWWMATNLNFKSDESYCLENEEVNGNKYGRLYTWKSSLTACPKGWHLPSKKEWEKMLNEIQNENESPNTDYYQVIKKDTLN